jgi:hypothetical protein
MRYRRAACLAVLWTLGSIVAFAQAPIVTLEHRGAVTGVGTGAPVIEVSAGASATLVFRVSNPANLEQTVMARLDRPANWQALFVSDRHDLAPRASVIETVTLAVPKSAASGDYLIRYELRMPSSDAISRSSVTIRVAERRQLSLAWQSTPPFLAADEAGSFDLIATNQGNRTENVTIDVRSILGVPVRATWTHGSIAAGETQRVRVFRQANNAREGGREVLIATASSGGLAATEASLGFDVVPQGRAPDPRRTRLPATVSVRTGTRRSLGFGSFIGSGALNTRRTAAINFGFVARDRSHPLMFERDRNFLTLTAPGVSLSAGDQTWALSYLTENGHYGLGVGGRVDRPHWSAGAFVDTGRYDVREGSQAGAFVGLATGRAARVSVQYLARFADDLQSDRIADIGSLRLVLKPTPAFTADFELGAGQSAAGTGRAVSALVTFNSRRASLYGRRVRRDDTYPLRDRTGVIDGAGISLRPFGQLHLDGTLDGTSEVEDPTLPITAPTRQRTTAARVAWGSFGSVRVGRTEWTAPGQDWSAAWRRESIAAEARFPLGALWLSPGIERGTEATPFYAETPYTLSWLQAGVRMGARNSADVRLEYGRGDAGVANRIVRRISFGAALQPLDATRLTFRLNNGGRDALWLQGSQSISATLDLRLPWRHHINMRYERRSGAGHFRPDDEAYRVDYVVPIGIPLRPAGDSGRVTVRLRDGESGQPRARVLVQLNRQSRLTDSNGVVTFSGLKPGEYHVTLSPASIGLGRTVVPSMPLSVSVKGGGHVEINASIVRTGSIAGALRMFQPAGGPPVAGQPPSLAPGAPIANALIELLINEEHRLTMTDADGNFAFDDVPPGTWAVRVVRADVPPFYFLEQAQLIATIAPSQSVRLMFRVVPKLQ